MKLSDDGKGSFPKQRELPITHIPPTVLQPWGTYRHGYYLDWCCWPSPCMVCTTTITNNRNQIVYLCVCCLLCIDIARNNENRLWAHSESGRSPGSKVTNYRRLRIFRIYFVRQWKCENICSNYIMQARALFYLTATFVVPAQNYAMQILYILNTHYKIVAQYTQYTYSRCYDDVLLFAQI